MKSTIHFKEHASIQLQPNPWLVLLIALIGTVSGCASIGKTMTGGESACAAAQETDRKVPPTLTNVDDILIVDCLLPGQPIHLGNMLWMSPSRPARISAWECNVQGGQYAIDANSDARQMAINVWQHCADQGDKVAQNYLGEIYTRSWGTIKPDFTLAVEWFRKAAEQGYSRAQKNLGTLYEQGLGVPKKDPETAFKLYRQAIGQIASISIAPNTKEEIQELSKKLNASNQKVKILQEQLNAPKQKSDVLDKIKKPNPPESNQAQAKELEDIRRDNQKLREQLDKTKTHAALGVRPYMGQYYALIIGIDNYPPSLDSLKTPVNDAKQVDALLREKYGFKTTLLTDDTTDKPTRGGIYKALLEINDKLTENDNLLIYYAGHGDISYNRYHWLPQDADSKDHASWISLDDIKSQIDDPPLKAKRVLIVADSCYPAGIIASVINATPVTTATINAPLLAMRGPPTTLIGSMSAQTGMPNLADSTPEAQVAWIKAKSENVSRTALTSGLLEPVLDVDSGNGLSIFANAFVEALKKNDDVISAEQIYLDISPEVFAKVKKIGKTQMPAYGAISNTSHNFGEFFFVSASHQSNLQEDKHRIATAIVE
jgi:hypothetical protein